jgi:hypothetical protein
VHVLGAVLASRASVVTSERRRSAFNLGSLASIRPDGYA